MLFTPATPRKFPQFTKDPFNFIDAQDLCLYHPLDDFGTVERCVLPSVLMACVVAFDVVCAGLSYILTGVRSFVTVASLDPDVDMIRMTGYRLGRKSAMAEALMEAAKRVRFHTHTHLHPDTHAHIEYIHTDPYSSSTRRVYRPPDAVIDTKR